MVFLLIFIFLIILSLFFLLPKEVNVLVDDLSDSFFQRDLDTSRNQEWEYLNFEGFEQQMVLKVKPEFKVKLFNKFGYSFLKANACIIGFSGPQFFEITLTEGENSIKEFSQGYPMKFSLNGDIKKIYLRIKLVNPEFTLDYPSKIKFKIFFSISSIFSFLPGSKVEHILNREFFIGPNLGDTWMGLDPGTSGSCVVAGSIHTEGFCIQKIDGKEKITPSVISFDTAYSSTIYQSNNTIKDSAYRFGFEAQALSKLSRYRSFRSIKKLLGFKNIKLIEFASGDKIEINGVGLSNLLIKEITNDFYDFLNEQIEKNLTGIETPQRVVLAVPNNFNASKINDLYQSIKTNNRFSEIRYIHEAEALLCYYISNFEALNNGKKSGKIDETVLAFDMGGATINSTIADVFQVENRGSAFFEIEIDSQLGYGVGGDSIDYCLLKTLISHLEGNPDFQGKNPFTQTSKEAQSQRRNNVYQIIKDLKLKIIDRYYNEPLIVNNGEKNPLDDRLIGQSKFEEISNNKFLEKKALLIPGELEDFIRDIFGIDNKVTFNSALFSEFCEDTAGRFPIFSNKYFKKLIFKPITEIVKETLDLSQGDGGYLDTIIFSGRSCLFPMVKETVIKECKKRKSLRQGEKEDNINPKIITFSSSEEYKSSIAKGACFYGIHKGTINISKSKVNNHFGVWRAKGPNKYSNFDYIDLINASQSFSGNSSFLEGQITTSDRFKNDAGYVNFYQFFGDNPIEIINKREKHKFSKISSIYLDMTPEKMGLKVFKNDSLECYVKFESGKTKSENGMEKKEEISIENDEHYTWTVI